MKENERKPYYHLMDDWTLVEIPNMTNAFDDFNTVAKYAKAYAEQDLFGMIDILRGKVEEFDKLCEVESADAIMKMVVRWAAEAAPLVLGEDDDK